MNSTPHASQYKLLYDAHRIEETYRKIVSDLIRERIPEEKLETLPIFF